jgi:hypothetical protein
LVLQKRQRSQQNFLTMPPPPEQPRATVWECHRCRNGFMSIANHPSCIDCGHVLRHCPYCKLRRGAASTRSQPSRANVGRRNARQLLQSSTPDASSPLEIDSASILQAHPLPPESGDTMPLPINELGPTYIYWYCCHCGDGPKKKILQPACVICNHPVCENCPVTQGK